MTRTSIDPMKWLSLAGAAIAVAGWLVSQSRDYQKAVDAAERLAERVRVLEQITVSEHPEYSPAIYVKGER